MGNVDETATAIDDATAYELLPVAEAAATPGTPDREQHAARLLEAPADVVAAVERLLRIDPQNALRMVAALTMFWQDAGLVDEGRRLTDRAIVVSGGASTPMLARALVAAAELAFRQGAQSEAEQHCDRAIEAGGESGDHGAIALAHVNLARIAYRAGDAPRIEAHAQRALEMGADDPAARRGALHMLAWAAHTAGDFAGARRRFEESLAWRRQQDDRFGVAVEIANLGDLAVEQGDLRDGARRLADALVVARDLDSGYLVLNLLPSLAAVAARAGDDEAGARLLGAMDALSRSSGLSPDPGNWQPVLDEAADRLGTRFDDLRTEGAKLGTSAAVELGLRVSSAVSAG